MKNLQYSLMHMHKPGISIRNFIIGVLLMILGGVVGYKVHGASSIQSAVTQVASPLVNYKLLSTQQPTDFREVDFSQFWDVWRILQSDYVDPSKVKQDEMVYGAIKGMTSSLGDPYTMYLPPTDQKRSENQLAVGYSRVYSSPGVKPLE